MRQFRIEERKVGEGEACFIVAEMGLSHEGSLGAAHAFIDAVAETGADAVKFQTHIAEAEDERLQGFATALHELLEELAILVAKDGEGLTKFVTVHVEGAEDDRAARKIALAIGNSPLVKTAMAGEDPNWGRIVMAVGKAGEAADRDRLAIWFGDTLVAKDGERAPDYVEEAVAQYMKGAEITVRVNVGVGNGRATVWTCDLTHGYIDINADYRT